MDCEKYLELMSAALDGECSAGERRELDCHLAVCPRCAALFEALSAQSAALRELDCDAPDGLTARIMADLPEQKKPGRAIRWKRWGALAACLVLAAGVGVLIPRGMRMGSAAPMTAESSDGLSPGNSTQFFGAVKDRGVDAAESGGSASGAPGDLSGDAAEPGDSASGAPGDLSGDAAKSGYSVSGATGDLNGDAARSGGSVPGATGDLIGDAEPEESTGGDIMPSPQLKVDPGNAPFSGPVSSPCAFGNPQVIRVRYGATPAAPSALVIGSAEELAGYLAQFGSLAYDGDGNPLPIEALEALAETYAQEFFETRRLLCVVVEAGSGSNRYELDPQGLTRESVSVRVTVPEEGTCDMAAWLLVAEVDDTFDGGDTLEVVFTR